MGRLASARCDRPVSTHSDDERPHHDITFPDGKKLFVGSSGTGASDERPER
jgi:hypothetical protein